MIIRILDNLSDTEALKAVLKVIELGRISNNNTQYCYATQLTLLGMTYIVYAEKTKGGQDKFIVRLNK